MLGQRGTCLAQATARNRTVEMEDGQRVPREREESEETLLERCNMKNRRLHNFFFGAMIFLELKLTRKDVKDQQVAKGASTTPVT